MGSGLPAIVRSPHRIITSELMLGSSNTFIKPDEPSIETFTSASKVCIIKGHNDNVEHNALHTQMAVRFILASLGMFTTFAKNVYPRAAIFGT